MALLVEWIQSSYCVPGHDLPPFAEGAICALPRHWPGLCSYDFNRTHACRTARAVRTLPERESAIYVYMYVYMHMYVYIYTYMYINMCIYVYVHMYS